MKRVFAALNIQIFVCLLVSFMLLLCGCNRSETSSDAPASSAPETVQTTQVPVKKSKALTPQEELEKLAPVPADCTVPDLRRDKSSGNACKCSDPKRRPECTEVHPLS